MSGCVHCFPVEAVYASANSWRGLAVERDDLNGERGDHHTSQVRPSPIVPMDSMTDGKSSAFGIVHTFGWKPC